MYLFRDISVYVIRDKIAHIFENFIRFDYDGVHEDETTTKTI